MSVNPWDRWVVPVLPELISSLKPTLLLPHLLDNELISLSEYHEVRSLPTEEEAARFLILDVLMRRLPRQHTFEQFCNILRKVESQRSILEHLIKCDEPTSSSSQIGDRNSAEESSIPHFSLRDGSAVRKHFSSPIPITIIGSLVGKPAEETSPRQDFQAALLEPRAFFISDSLDADAESIYKKACEIGTVPVNRCRLIVIGQDGAGKSCFIDSLFDRLYKPKNPSTKGIAINMAVTGAEGKEDGGVWTACDHRKGQYLRRYIAAGYAIMQRKEMLEDPGEVIATAETNESQEKQESALKRFKEDSHFNSSEIDKHIDELTGGLALTEEQQEMMREYLKSDEALGSLEGCEVSMKLLWDLGGQERYLTTHTALMPKTSAFTVCKYLLLTDMSKHFSDKAKSFVRGGAGCDDQPVELHYIERNIDFVRHWLSSIAIAHPESHPSPYLGEFLEVSYPAVLIGGTHMDLVSIMENSNDFLRSQNAELDKVIVDLKCQDHIFKPSDAHKLFPNHVLAASEDDWFFPIDNTKSGQGDEPRCQCVNAIRAIVDSSSKKYWLEKNKDAPMPVAWLRFELLLVNWKLGKVINLKTAIKLAQRSNIDSEKEALVALKFLHGLGVIFYYWDVPALAHSIIVDPMWLIAAVAAAVPPTPSVKAKHRRMWKQLQETGEIAKYVISDLLREAHVRLEDEKPVLEVLKLLDIVCEGPQSKNFVIPSLVENKLASTSSWQAYDPSGPFPPPIVIFPRDVQTIPAALFFRLVARCIREYPKSFDLSLDRCTFQLGSGLILELLHFNRGDCLIASIDMRGGDRDDALGCLAGKTLKIQKFMLGSLESAKQQGMSGLELDVFYQVDKIPHGNVSRRAKFLDKVLVKYCDDCDPEVRGGIVVYKSKDSVTRDHLGLVHRWFQSKENVSNEEASMVSASEESTGLLRTKTPVNDDELVSLSSVLASTWKHVARRLGVPKEIIDQCKVDNVNDTREQAFQMLSWWSQKEGRNASVGCLCKALLKEHLSTTVAEFFGDAVLDCLSNC